MFVVYYPIIQQFLECMSSHYFCPNLNCTNHQNPPDDFYKKKGYYKPKHNHQPIPRYQCKTCGKYFSSATFKETTQQHKPELNQEIFKLLVSDVCQRRTAKIVGCSKRTVDKKLKYLALQAQAKHQEAIATKALETSCIQVDEMETYEHTKCKPLSVALAVRHKTGEILGIEVGKMPAKGLLAQIGANKYGWTYEERPRAFTRLMLSLQKIVKPSITFKSDSHMSYGKWITAHYPHATLDKYLRPKLPAGSKKPFDPLFKVNNTCAKLRNDLARFGKKTWCSTKSQKSLLNHLWLYVAWNNGYLIR